MTKNSQTPDLTITLLAVLVLVHPTRLPHTFILLKLYFVGYIRKVSLWLSISYGMPLASSYIAPRTKSSLSRAFVGFA